MMKHICGLRRPRAKIAKNRVVNLQPCGQIRPLLPPAPTLVLAERVHIGKNAYILKQYTDLTI